MEEKIKILLCEDDENLGMLLREYLQAKGFTTVLCPDGEVGYKEFNKNKFDIAVLDVMMPKKDGCTLACTNLSPAEDCSTPGPCRPRSEMAPSSGA